MSPEQFQSFYALAVGFALSGMLASGYRWLANRPASFRLLQGGPIPATFACIPLLMFAAPFIIIRSTLDQDRDDALRFRKVMLATVVAGLWSLMSGTVVVMALMALGA
jgi:hypothetical protein